MQQSPLSRFLVASRTMRTLYAVAKVSAFLMLGLVVVVERAEAGGTQLASQGIVDGLVAVTAWVVYLTVATCVVRALPVIWDARAFFRHRPPSAPTHRPLPSPEGTG